MGWLSWGAVLKGTASRTQEGDWYIPPGGKRCGTTTEAAKADPCRGGNCWTDGVFVRSGSSLRVSLVTHVSRWSREHSFVAVLNGDGVMLRSERYTVTRLMYSKCNSST